MEIERMLLPHELARSVEGLSRVVSDFGDERDPSGRAESAFSGSRGSPGSGRVVTPDGARKRPTLTAKTGHNATHAPRPNTCHRPRAGPPNVTRSRGPTRTARANPEGGCHHRRLASFEKGKGVHMTSEAKPQRTIIDPVATHDSMFEGAAALPFFWQADRRSSIRRCSQCRVGLCASHTSDPVSPETIGPIHQTDARSLGRVRKGVLRDG